jgi:hypothetical protein
METEPEHGTECRAELAPDLGTQSSSDLESELMSMSDGSTGSDDGISSGNECGMCTTVDDALLGAKSSGVKIFLLTG